MEAPAFRRALSAVRPDAVPRAGSAFQHGEHPRTEDIPEPDALAGVPRALEGAPCSPRRAHRARGPRGNPRRRERGRGGREPEGLAGTQPGLAWDATTSRRLLLGKSTSTCGRVDGDRRNSTSTWSPEVDI